MENTTENGMDLLVGMFTARGLDFETVMLNAERNAEERLKWIGGVERKYHVRMSLAAADIDRDKEFLEDVLLRGEKVVCVAQADVLVFKDEVSYERYISERMIIFKEF